MAVFTVTNTETSRSAGLELDVDSNAWRVVGGDAALLGADSGTWNADGIQDAVFVRGAGNDVVVRFDRIDVKDDQPDPFEALSPGADSGGGVLGDGTIIGWLFEGR
ncbi:MAG: hypothetical protein U0835_26125 [Isosphaeraceae bacterium]